jgi:hypothetical protein
LPIVFRREHEGKATASDWELQSTKCVPRG